MDEKNMADNEELSQNIEEQESSNTATEPEVTETDNSVSTTPVEKEDVSKTQAFAKRLKEEKAKVEQEARDNLAVEMGYENYHDMMEQQRNKKIVDHLGLDPDKVKPLLKELLQDDPEYQDALKFKKERETLDKKIWVDNSLKELNDTFSLNIKKLDDLDAETIEMWNNGIDLKKAYAANNYTTIEKIAQSKVKTSNGKEHLKQASGSTTAAPIKTVSKDEISAMMTIFNMNESEAREYILNSK